MSKSDCFTLLGFEPSIDLDDAQLKAAYFKLQRDVHPDKSKNDTQRLRSVQLSADINQAYNTLKDSVSRLYYFLKLKGHDILAEGQTAPSPILLMETMELREELDDVRGTSDHETFYRKICQLEEASFANACAAISENNIDRAVEAATRLRYLSRIKQESSLGTQAA